MTDSFRYLFEKVNYLVFNEITFIARYDWSVRVDSSSRSIYQDDKVSSLYWIVMYVFECQSVRAALSASMHFSVF